MQKENERYMIASGVPFAVRKQLGDIHAAQIATLALDIMNGASGFVIPHNPRERLRLRFGIHSGPAVGGIQRVGNIMPR